jgi:hypothetical protein
LHGAHINDNIERIYASKPLMMVQSRQQALLLCGDCVVGNAAARLDVVEVVRLFEGGELETFCNIA